MISEVLVSLQQYLAIVDDDFDNMLLVDEDLETAIPQLRTNPILPVFDEFLSNLLALVIENRDSFLFDNFAVTGTIHIIDFNNPELSKKNRGFAYSDNQFAFFSAKSLFDSGRLVSFSLMENGLLWKQMEMFFVHDFSPRQGNIVNFFDCLTHQDSSKGFLIKHIPDAFNAERHYAYVYLSFLNSAHSVKLPSVLNYSSTLLNTGLTFASNVEFEQYFDIYDVLNELNQAPDLLTRFLKLYHVLEYYMYRLYLVDLVGRVGANKFFVREFITSAERMKRGERETFIANFFKIFSTDSAIIHGAVNPYCSPVVISFLSDHNFSNSFVGSNVKKVGELIYGLRCAIVHNKESEYHLTVSFYDDFVDIIPVIKALTGIMENLIIEKIKTNHSHIKYPRRDMTLY